ncbi:MAG: transporter associated domain-containing protein [Candidatus Binatia bacterium]
MKDPRTPFELLREMRRRHVLIAMVVDEPRRHGGHRHHGGSGRGAFVGEIFSEHVKQEPELFRREAGGTVLLDGAARARRQPRPRPRPPRGGRLVGVAGLCLATAGRIPAVGDRLALANGLTLEIVDATPRRVRTVRAHPAREP